MAKIKEVLEAKISLIIECDCRNRFTWVNGGNEKCPVCKTEYELVMGPRKIDRSLAASMINSRQIRIPQARQPQRPLGRKIA